jgi:formate/nitrite transporter FocA (FNT family)
MQQGSHQAGERAAEPEAGALDADERRESEQRMSPGAAVVHEAIMREGEDELARAWSARAFSGLAAGLSMGFSFATEGLLAANLPDEPWRPLVSKLGYTVGFLIVVLGRQQLFTENTLTPILPLLQRPRAHVLRNVARLWAIVLAANLVGAFIFAEVAAHTETFGPAKGALDEIGHATLDGSFMTLFFRAIFAGWLIALMVWILPFAETGRLFAIIIITYVVGIGMFTHVIAGSVDVMYLVARDEASWGEFLRFLAPALLGNIIGGVALVAALNHAQVASGEG